MTATIRVRVTATFHSKTYSGEAAVEDNWRGDTYNLAHMTLIRDLPAGRQGDRVPLREQDYDAGTLVWSPEGWLYERPEFSHDEQHLLRRLASDACRYRDCRGATLDRLRARGLALWSPTTGLPTAGHCWVSLTKAGFAVADRLTGRR
jgi:hypothetical protein